jgi:hypothetical protein
MARRFFYTVGLDLGQVSDFSACAVLEQEWLPACSEDGRCHHECRHLVRWPLGTDYPTVVQEVCGILARLREQPGPDEGGPCVVLVVDRTGVGRGVADLFARADLHRAGFSAVTITAGSELTEHPDGGLNVPKRELVAATQSALQTKRLKIAPRLREAAALVRELRTFTVKVNIATGAESFESWREKDKDDLVLSIALAVWQGERSGPPWAPAVDPDGSLLQRLLPADLKRMPPGFGGTEGGGDRGRNGQREGAGRAWWDRQL